MRGFRGSMVLPADTSFVTKCRTESALILLCGSALHFCAGFLAFRLEMVGRTNVACLLDSYALIPNAFVVNMPLCELPCLACRSMELDIWLNSRLRGVRPLICKHDHQMTCRSDAPLAKFSRSQILQKKHKVVIQLYSCQLDLHGFQRSRGLGSVAPAPFVNMMIKCHADGANCLEKNTLAGNFPNMAMKTWSSEFRAKDLCKQCDAQFPLRLAVSSHGLK